ncbi:hypothetical protein D3C81_1250290 [compost metagenome]
MDVLGQCADTCFIGVENAGGEHGLGASALHLFAGGGDEALQRRPLTGDHQARVGTKLPGALCQRSDETLRQCFAAALQGCVKQEYRVDRTHLGIHRDWLRACLSGVAQRNATAA